MKANIKIILLSVALVLLVAGGVECLFLGDSNEPRKAPKGMDTYDAVSYNNVAEEVVYCNSYDGYLTTCYTII